MRGVPRERRAISTRRRHRSRIFSRPAERVTIWVSSSDRIKLEPGDDAEAITQRIRQHAGARRGAHQRKRRQVELDRSRRRAFADHDVQLVILERRVKNLLYDRREPVDLINEEHIVGLKVGQQGRQIARPLEHGAGSLAQVYPHLAGNDMCDSVVLPKPGRPEQQHVVERFPAPPRGLDEYLQLLANLFLADVLFEMLGPQRPLQLFLSV